MGTSRRLNVLERHHLPGVFLTHRAAEEAGAVEQPDFGQVAGVVADGDRLADEAGERRGDVAQALEADAVAPHATRLGMQDQQEVEVLEGVGKARQETPAAPGVERGRADPAVDTDVVGAGDERGECAVELRQR